MKFKIYEDALTQFEKAKELPFTPIETNVSINELLGQKKKD